jgi:hypothetical protein
MFKELNCIKTCHTTFIAESVDLGNSNHFQRNPTDDLKNLVIDNIFVLGKMVGSGIRVNADDRPISI